MDRELKDKFYDNSDCISEKTMYMYIDKKLSAKEEHIVEKHLIDCELCSDALEGLRLTKNRNRINEINTAIKEKLSPGKGKVDLRIIISVAAGLLLLVGGVFFFNQFVSYNKENTVALKTLPVEEKEIKPTPLSESNEQKPDNSVESYKTIEEKKIVSAEKNDEDLKETNTIHVDEVREESKFSELSIAKDESGNTETDDNRPDQDLQNAPAVSNNTISTGTTAIESLTKNEQEKVSDKSENKAKEQTQISADKGTSKKNKYRSKPDAKKEDASDVLTKAAPATAEGNNELLDLEQSSDQSKTINDSLISFSGETENVYSVVDEMPVYPGGPESLAKYISQHLSIPVSGNNDNSQLTTILIQFIVDSKGKASKPKLIKPENKDLEKQVIDIINKMPQWTPGKLNGREVNVMYNLPVKVHIR